MKRIFSLFFCSITALSFNADAQYKKIITLAGTNPPGGYGGDGYTATSGTLNGPLNVALDKTGNIYIVDYYNFRVRKIKKSDNTIVTFAGNGISGNNGDGTAATNAEMNPRGVAADHKGNVFISDNRSHVIRKVNTATNIVTTYAGTGTAGYTGDGGSAVLARLNTPMGMQCDRRGNLYFADAGNHCIRRIDTLGRISTVAGDGTSGFGGDGFSALTARLDSPYTVAVAPSGALLIADHGNNRIRMVDVTGLINTFAGNGVYAYSGDGGLAVNCSFNYPTGVAVDTAGNVYISDSYNNVIREVDITGNINTIVGNSWPGFGGDLGDPLGANLFHPYGVAVDTFGSVYIADANNERIRKVYTTTLGVEDLDPNGTAVYPNPFNNNITVAGVRRGNKVALYDIMGRQIQTMTATTDGEQTFTIGDLANGIYLLEVNDEAGRSRGSFRMVK